MIPVSGPMMQEKALAISQQLNLSDFKASTGWLRSFKQRHDINGARICYTCVWRHIQMWPHVPMPVLRPRLYYGHKWPVPRVAVIEAFYCIHK